MKDRWVTPLYMTAPADLERISGVELEDHLVTCVRVMQETTPGDTRILLGSTNWRWIRVGAWLMGAKRERECLDALTAAISNEYKVYTGEAFAFALARVGGAEAVAVCRTSLNRLGEQRIGHEPHLGKRDHAQDLLAALLVLDPSLGEEPPREYAWIDPPDVDFLLKRRLEFQASVVDPAFQNAGPLPPLPEPAGRQGSVEEDWEDFDDWSEL